MTTPSSPDTPANAIAQTFVQQFRAVWAAPTVDRIDALMNPQVRYTQPLLADVVGRERASQYWQRVFTVIPDLHLDIVNWAVTADDAIYIEFLIKGTFGRRQLSLPAVDRYELDGAGRVTRRVLYCDSLTIAGAVFRPLGMFALVRAGIRIGIDTATAAFGSAHRGRYRR
jgi:hypothetical protein